MVRVGEATSKVKKLSKIFPNEEAARAAAEAVLYQEQRSDYVLTLDDFPFIPGVQAERNILVSSHARKEFNTEWMCSKVSEVLGTDGHTLSGEFVIPKQNFGDIPRL
ncbi:hypothetical protein TW71_007870 [Vibrio coralliilyticus]|uniref:hypothetical protein n=1 Tax=Vibrio coralliilyticus TaxID=190893 RepID=UPI000698C2F1|nr:hypothetical protein [Vibrio coralliilyticus]QOU28565.1 hypothetical protein TW71_007870 [Vibrio coralliilyticus]